MLWHTAYEDQYEAEESDNLHCYTEENNMLYVANNIIPFGYTNHQGATLLSRYVAFIH